MRNLGLLRNAWLTRRRYGPPEDWPSGYLALFSFGAGVHLYFLGPTLWGVQPLIIQGLNSEGVTPIGVIVMTIVATASIYLSILAFMLKQWLEVLYRRWFM